MIVMDILLALSLAAVFAAGIAACSVDAGEIFERAQDRAGLLSLYALHGSEFRDLLPGDARSISYETASSSEPAVMAASARWYGDDRIETDISVRRGSREISFAYVRAYPLADMEASAGTPLCAPQLPGSAPHMRPITLPVPPLLPLTDIQVRNGIAYITADSAVSSDPDLIVADIGSGHPQLLSSLNTGPGLAALAVAGNHIFAAAASSVAQLHVIRADSPASLALEDRFQLPLPEASSSAPFATAISYRDRRIYLGTEKWEGDELAVIDVSVPESPAVIGGLETGSKVNAIAVRNSDAYVGASDQQQMRTLDISDAGRPVLLGSFSPSGWQRQEGRTISTFEGSLLFGRTSGGFDISQDHELFAWNGASAEPVSLNVAGGVYGIIPNRDRIFAISREADKEFAVFDQRLATTAPRFYPLPVAPQAMTCDLDKLYVLARTAPVIYEITFPANE